MTDDKIIEMSSKAGFNGLFSLIVFARMVAEKAVEESNHIIYKSCINLPHWKRTAMRYLKRNAPMLHHQAVTEFNEHPDGRGKE